MPNLGEWAAAIVAAAMVGGITARFAARNSPTPPTRLQWFAVLAVLLGGLAGHAVLGMWPRFPPTGALDRLLVVILPGSILLELLLARWSLTSRWVCLLRALAASCWIRVLLHGSVYLQPPSLIVVWPTIVLGGGLLGSLQWSKIRLASRAHRASLLPLWAACLGTAGLMILLAGYLKGGAVALVWSSAVFGTSLGVVADRRSGSMTSVVGVVDSLLCGFALVGCLFGAVQPWAAAAVIGAPLTGWLVEFSSCRTWPTAARELCRWTLVLGTLLALLVAAKLRFDRELRPLLSHGQSELLTERSLGEASGGWGRA